ncbi:MAG TPA: hypothetical protein DCK99_02785 [Blastocatellia bacterium]|jgi:hypothetical protein|nr:hypothetical protein [Blastocatellia bacterium]
MNTKEKRRVSDEEFERQYAELQNAKPQPELRATEAFYDHQRENLVIKLENGSTITTPISALSEFRGANPSDIAAVELRPRRTSLHWERLDQDFTVGGLIASVFGRNALMRELGRKGGSATTVAKAAAARENGRKGGRPRKEKDQPPSFVLHLGAPLIQPRMELSDLIVSGQSHQTTKNLIKYKESLNSLERSIRPLKKNLTSQISTESKPVTQARVEGIKEAQGNATLALAA